jgi:hypothetical protein
MHYFFIAQRTNETFENFALPNQAKNLDYSVSEGGTDSLFLGTWWGGRIYSQKGKRLNFSENLHSFVV